MTGEPGFVFFCLISSSMGRRGNKIKTEKKEYHGICICKRWKLLLVVFRDFLVNIQGSFFRNSNVDFVAHI